MKNERPRTIRRRAQRAFAKKVERELKAHAQAQLKDKVEPAPADVFGPTTAARIERQRRYGESDSEYAARMELQGD